MNTCAETGSSFCAISCFESVFIFPDVFPAKFRWSFSCRALHYFWFCFEGGNQFQLANGYCCFVDNIFTDTEVGRLKDPLFNELTKPGTIDDLFSKIKHANRIHVNHFNLIVKFCL